MSIAISMDGKGAALLLGVLVGTNRMLALATASQMASASATVNMGRSLFRRGRRRVIIDCEINVEIPLRIMRRLRLCQRRQVFAVDTDAGD